MERGVIDHEQIEAARQFLRSHGDQLLPWSRVLIAAEALAQGLDLDYEQRNRQLTILRGRRRYYFRGLTTNYNTALARRLCRLRDATGKYLLAMEQPAFENCVFEAGEEEMAWEWSQRILPVSVQANNRMKNLPIFRELATEAEFRDAFARIAEEQPGGVLVQEDPPGEDYRALVVGGEIVAMSHLTPAYVVGDGQSTVELPAIAQNKKHLPYRGKLELGESEVDILARSNLSPMDVVEAGRQVDLALHLQEDSKGYATDVMDSMDQDHMAVVQQAVALVPGLRLAGVEARVIDSTQGSRLMLTGITARPDIAVHQFPQEGHPQNIARAVLDAMFPPE